MEVHHLGTYATGGRTAVQERYNGHNRTGAPRRLRRGANDGVSSTTTSIAPCGIMYVFIERKMVRARCAVHEHHPIVLDGLVFDRPWRVSRPPPLVLPSDGTSNK